MGSDDLTTTIVIEVRNEIRGTNQRFDRLEDRLDKRIDDVGARIDGVGVRLTDRVTEVEITTLTQLASAVNEVTTLLRDRLDLRDPVDRCERDIDELERKVN